MRDIVRIAGNHMEPHHIAGLVAKAIKAGRRMSEVRLEVKQQEELGNPELADIATRFAQAAADGERVVKCLKLEARHFSGEHGAPEKPTIRDLTGPAQAIVAALYQSSVVAHWVAAASIEVDKEGVQWLVVRWETSSSFTGKDPPCGD